MREDYMAILHHPHHISTKRHTMSMHDRAAQFAPFAALTGYDEEVSEVARLTNSQHELSEEQLENLNHKLMQLSEMENEKPLISVTYFKSDEKKSGDAYITITGNFRFFDEAQMLIKMMDGMEIPIADILEIQFG